jgi:DNA polymerase-3 subunit gamma/tau
LAPARCGEIQAGETVSRSILAEAKPGEVDDDQPGNGNETSSAPSFNSFEDLVSHVARVRDIRMKLALEEQVELVKFGPGFLELHLLEGAPQNLAQDLSRKMQAWTGERWVVSLSEARGTMPLGLRRRAEEAQAVEEIRKHPAVKSVLHHFPDAEIKSVRTLDS